MQYISKCLLLEDDESNFKKMLKVLSVERSKIFEAMVFAIKHSECSAKIIELVDEQCQNRLAGLYLISDILYNCNKVDVQYSWSYLPLVRTQLPKMMARLKHSDSTLAVISVWENWGIFDKKYLLGLRSIVDERNYLLNKVSLMYSELLYVCDEYFIKNKCEEFGQLVEGTTEERVARILYFINYVLITSSIKEHWVLVDVDSAGSSAEAVIELANKSLDQLTSSELKGQEIDKESIQIIKKISQKYPGVYICKHS